MVISSPMATQLGVSVEREAKFKILMDRYLRYIFRLSNDDLNQIIKHPEAIKYYESL